MDWLTDNKIPVGRTAERVFDWLQTNGAGFFDAVSIGLETLIDGVLWLLQAPHPLVIVAIFVALTWLIQRSWKTCLLVALGFLFILNQGYWKETTESLTLVLASCIVCMGIGVPIGIAAAHRPRLYAWMRPVLDLMQTLPTFVYLIPAIVFFGIGPVPGLIATVIFVLPAPIRLTHLGVTSTPRALLEAAQAFGATRRQTLWKVELPYALPQIMAGLNQTIMLSLSMVVIAALVGAGDPGAELGQHRARLRKRVHHRGGRHHARPDAADGPEMTAAVVFDKVCIVFGEKPHLALPLMDQGKERAEIQKATQQVLGVHDCTLEVARGEILVLMGLSGSGKSTLLRAVNGLNPVARGEVRVSDGDRMVSVTKADAETLRHLRLTRIAMVFQQFGLLPWRTVREQLALVGLTDWADRKVGELSGGMQQRVGLARAFATDAPILLMDEPFSALDPLIRTRLQDELLDLQSRLQRTIIFVSHDLDEAFRLGNRIAIMEGGRIVQCGTPRDIFSAPASDYVADFVAEMNPLRILSARDVMEPAKGRPARSVDPETDIRSVMALVRAENGPVVTADTILARLLDPRG